MSLNIVSGFNGITDPDALAYVSAVEAADGQLLEFAVGKAINDFVVGCKVDGNWNAIKAGCVLSGARKKEGAFIDLRTATQILTNNGFADGDYNRKTGLVGDGSSKYLNSNRANNADPQSSKHISVYVSSACTVSTGFPRYIGVYRPIAPYDGSDIVRNGANSETYGFINSNGITRTGQLGFHGASRASASAFTYRSQGGQTTANEAVLSVVTGTIPVFAGRGTAIESYSNARLAFYSIGEAIDLAKLDARVTALITAFGAAIP